MENNNFDPSAMPTVAEQTTGNPLAMPSVSSSSNNASKFDFKKFMENKKLFYGSIAGVAALIVIIVVVCILTGGKKLVCIKSSEYSGVKESEKVVFKFKKDTPSVVRTITYDYTNDSDTSEEELQKQVKEFNEKKDEYTEGKFSVNASITGKVITLEYKYNDEQFKSTYKSIIDSLEDKSIDGYKKYFEGQKYTCK